MTDFEPTTDFPEYIDNDESPVESNARSHDRGVLRRRHRLIQLGILALGLGLLAFGLPVFRVVVALALMYVIVMGGVAVIGAFARPVPEAPPPGELRRVRLNYRCPTCGAELRMTLANDQIPQAPRHCADEMELVTPADEL
ncbi:MAG: hypothetical protein ACFCVK_06880 [Acidimicrobiales bacterium]